MWRSVFYLSLNSVPPLDDSSSIISSSSSSDSPDERNWEPAGSRKGIPRHGAHRPLLVSLETMYILAHRMHSSWGSPVGRREMVSIVVYERVLLYSQSSKNNNTLAVICLNGFKRSFEYSFNYLMLLNYNLYECYIYKHASISAEIFTLICKEPSLQKTRGHVIVK